VLTLDDIEALFARRGAEQYSGEPVTQLEHALQCAALAEAEGADDDLVTAALLHDLGDVHQYAALPFLRGLFGERVLGGIQLHVDAKRYLCATRPGYHEALSEDSKRSLKLQGGTFSDEQAQAFIARPGAADAVRLRIWDDLAKTAGAATPPLSHFMDRARRCALSGSAA
jgi:phosphonate degradation associated HDIG domain protein